MKFRILIFSIFLISLNVFADNDLEINSDSLNPLLEDIKIIQKDDGLRYRILIYRGGYEHISAYMTVQKYSVNNDNPDIPYNLLSSVSFDEINYLYNFEIKSIQNTENGFTVVLDAVHSYLYEETEIIIKIFETMEYEIISGLVQL